MTRCQSCRMKEFCGSSGIASAVVLCRKTSTRVGKKEKEASRSRNVNKPKSKVFFNMAKFHAWPCVISHFQRLCFSVRA